jgi:hypothetical protein
MATGNVFKLGAVARCQDCGSPKVTAGQWVCAAQLLQAGTQVVLHVFDAEDDAKMLAADLAAGGGAATAPAPVKICQKVLREIEIDSGPD